MRKILLLALILGLVGGPGWCATYTVCPSGCDETDPQAPLTNNDLEPGDIIEIRAATPGGTITHVLSSRFRAAPTDIGDAASDVIIRGRAGDTVILDGNGGAFQTVDMQGLSYITLENLTIQGGYKVDGYYGIYAYAAHDITLSNVRVTDCYVGVGLIAKDNVDVYNITISGASIYSNTRMGIKGLAGEVGADTGRIYDLLITDSYIYSNGSSGIEISSVAWEEGADDINSALTIRGNQIYLNGLYGIAINDGNTDYGSTLISDNIIRDNGQSPAGASANGLWVANWDGPLIEDNIVYGNLTGDIDGIGIFLDFHSAGHVTKNAVVRRNKVYNHDSCITQDPYGVGTAFNSSGIALCCGVHDNQIYNNVSYGNTNGIAIGGSTYDNDIYNNTITGNRIGLYSNLTSGGGTGNTFMNNILANNTKTGDGETTVFDYYRESSGDEDLAESYNLFGASPAYENHTKDATSLESAPLLNTDYSLTASSPCINAGTEAATVGLSGDLTDGFGNSDTFAGAYNLNIGADQTRFNSRGIMAGKILSGKILAMSGPGFPYTIPLTLE